MLALSRDQVWLSRLERLAARLGYGFVAAPDPLLPNSHASEKAMVVVVLDRTLAGASPAPAILGLRRRCPGAAIALACDGADLEPEVAATALSCGADALVLKSWSDERLVVHLSALRDGGLSTLSRASSDGALHADQRAHRAQVLVGGRWRPIGLDAGSFALLWRLLEREGRLVSRAELAIALEAALGREFQLGSLGRRLAALRKALAPWRGRIETARGGGYRLVHP